MKNSHRTIKIIFFIIILINIVFPFVQKVQAAEIDDPMYFTPQVGIGTEIQVGEKIKIDEWTFVNYVVAIYDWSIKAIVLLAIVMIMYAGFKWMMAGGNASSITKARDQIISALIGLVLAIGSYTLLNFINPSLVNLRNLSIDPVKRENLIIIDTCSGMIITGIKRAFRFDAEKKCSSRCKGEFLVSELANTEEQWCCDCVGCPTGSFEKPEDYDSCYEYCTSQDKWGGQYTSAYPNCCMCEDQCISKRTECESVENPQSQDDCSLYHGCEGYDTDFICRYTDGKCHYGERISCVGTKIKGLYTNRVYCSTGGNKCSDNGQGKDCKVYGERICVDYGLAAEGIDAICCGTVELLEQDREYKCISKTEH